MGAYALTKADEARLDRYHAEAQSWASGLENALGDYNEAVKDATDAYNTRINDYNAWRQDVHGFIEDLRDAAQADYDDKSERWQDSDRGGECSEWIEALTEVVDAEELDTVEYEEYVPPITAGEFVTALEDMPRQAGY